MKFYKKTDSGTNSTRDSVGIVDDVIVITEDTTLRVEDSGRTFTIATDALTISLPETGSGLEYTFINTGAAGNNIIVVSPVGADGIAGVITLAMAVVTLLGVPGQDLVNVKATSQLGNAMTIVGTGITGNTAWLIKYSTGIWA